MKAPRAILITQCLQNDFVRPIAPGAPLPNRLHVGAREARRLMGENPAEGPVARMMAWAYARPADDLLLIHIRDSHAADNPGQASHLAHFGAHCLTGSEGAELAFRIPDAPRAGTVEVLSPTLNDFAQTGLHDLLRPGSEAAMRVGIMGVWTEAKVLFLCYELATRFPRFALSVCSALTAGSSLAGHLAALEQMRRLLGVRVCDSVGEFIEFLGGAAEAYLMPGVHASYPELAVEPPQALADEDRQLMRYLFRHCRTVSARLLGGGFSGNLVLGAQSTDQHGHEEAVHVVKIGPREAIGRERTAFEKIEEVLGNSAPRISDFADFGGRGAVKYRYASMSRKGARTFKQAFGEGLAPEKEAEVLEAVFGEQLGRLYAAGVLEACNLFEYYAFESRWAPGVRARIEALLGAGGGERLNLGVGAPFANPARFYEELDRIDPLRRDEVCFAYVHGDLNGANIIIDGRENVWLIDFFHTHRGHALRDLIKLENDLLYIFTPVSNEEELAEALRITEALTALDDLGAALPAAETLSLQSPALVRAWGTVRRLRGYYPGILREARGSLQWQIGALRYAVHTLSFDESSELQKKWALFTAGRCCERIRAFMAEPARHA